MKSKRCFRFLLLLDCFLCLFKVGVIRLLMKEQLNYSKRKMSLILLLHRT